MSQIEWLRHRNRASRRRQCGSKSSDDDGQTKFQRKTSARRAKASVHTASRAKSIPTPKDAVCRRQLCNPRQKLRSADSCDAAMHGNLPFLDRRCRRRRCKSGPTPAVCLGALGRRTQMRLGSACRKAHLRARVSACCCPLVVVQQTSETHQPPYGTTRPGRIVQRLGTSNFFVDVENGAKCYRLCCQRRQRFGNRRQRAFSYTLHLSFSVCPCHDPKQWLLH